MWVKIGLKATKNKKTREFSSRSIRIKDIIKQLMIIPSSNYLKRIDKRYKLTINQLLS